MLEILDQQASYLIIAAAGTMVLIAGGIDLSVGATYALCQVIATKMASILGGDGAIWRTVVGVLFIAVIGDGFTLLGWNPLYEQITLGVILLLAVGGDAWSRLRTG